MGVFGAITVYANNVGNNSLNPINNSTTTQQLISDINTNNGLAGNFIAFILSLFITPGINLSNELFIKIAIKSSLCIFIIIAIIILLEALKYKSENPLNLNYLLKWGYIFSFCTLIIFLLPFMYSEVDFQMTKYILLLVLMISALILFIQTEVNRMKNIKAPYSKEIGILVEYSIKVCLFLDILIFFTKYFLQYFGNANTIIRFNNNNLGSIIYLNVLVLRLPNAKSIVNKI